MFRPTVDQLRQPVLAIRLPADFAADESRVGADAGQRIQRLPSKIALRENALLWQPDGVISDDEIGTQICWWCMDFYINASRTNINE